MCVDVCLPVWWHGTARYGAERVPFVRAAHGGAGPGAAAGEAPRGQGAHGAQDPHQGRARAARGNRVYFMDIYKRTFTFFTVEDIGDSTSICTELASTILKQFWSSTLRVQRRYVVDDAGWLLSSRCRYTRGLSYTYVPGVHIVLC